MTNVDKLKVTKLPPLAEGAHPPHVPTPMASKLAMRGYVTDYFLYLSTPFMKILATPLHALDLLEITVLLIP